MDACQRQAAQVVQPAPPLTGSSAYYGPAAIPPPQPRQEPRRLCGFCLISTLIKAFVGIIVVLGITLLILWLVLRPNNLQVYVESASLTRFNLTSTGTLQYNMSTDISIRNPNSQSGVYYDWLEANTYYADERFSWVPLNSFYQGSKSTAMLYPLFTGQSVVSFGYSRASYFNSQSNRGGAFDVDLWIYGWIRFRIGPFNTRPYPWRVKCDLVLPLAANGTSRSGSFPRTQCDANY